MNNIEFFLGTEYDIRDFNKKVVNINKDNNINFSYLNSVISDYETRYEKQDGGVYSNGEFNHQQFYVGTLPLRTLPGKGLRFSEENTLNYNDLMSTQGDNVSPSVITLDFSKTMEQDNPFYFGTGEEKGLNLGYGKGIKIDYVNSKQNNNNVKGLTLNYNEDIFRIDEDDRLDINIGSLIDKLFKDEYIDKLGLKIGSLIVDKLSWDTNFKNDLKSALEN